MEKLAVQETVVKSYTFMGLPVIGDASLLSDPMMGVIYVNWDGNAEQVFLTTNFDGWKIENFESQDKGIPAIYLLSKSGKVFASVTYYKGYKSSPRPEERAPHFSVRAAKHTGDY